MSLRPRLNKAIAASMLLGIFLLSGCTASKTEYNFYTHPPGTNNLVAAPIATAYYPYQVQVYSYDHKPTEDFSDLGEISVDKINQFGFMRQQARIKTLLREQATIMGGDALIILPDDEEKACKAEVIKFNRNTDADADKKTQESKTNPEQ